MNKKFTLFWLTGKSEVIEADEGVTIEKAMTLAGYGGGAVKVLDFYANGDVRDKWNWNKIEKKWEIISKYNIQDHI